MVKIFSSFIVVIIMMSACAHKEGVRTQVVKETIIKEPSVINNTETFVIEAQECPVINCPVCEKPKPPVTKFVFKDYGKVVLGELEEVYLPAQKLSLQARIDTGATTSSLNAQEIVPFERDGKKWVRFNVLDNNKKIVQIKRPIIKTIKVKRHGEDGQERYVVKMRLNISSLSQFVEISLTDRSQYKFPVLVGRNFLKGLVLVDVSKKFTKEPSKENE